MTDKLDSQSRQDLILYRLSHAKETLKEADYNADGGYFNAATNKLYFACYYAASALMLSKDLETSTHAGTKRMLSLRACLKTISKYYSWQNSVLQHPLLFNNPPFAHLGDFY